ncbi:MAG: transporter [Actinomycetia bacterium]|nr:transporter [Actinomycetes bacterium]
MSALEHAAPTAAQAAPRLNRPFVAALMVANFGTNVALIAPIQNILPRMIESAVGSGDKAIGLGLVTGLGAFAALVVNPLAGHYSDRWVGADNRSVTVLIGLVTGGVAHFILGYQHSVVDIAIWWTLCQATINIAYSPMSAIVVDHVDRRSWGLVWGLISVAQALGLIIGLAAVVLVFPSVTAGMTAISVGYVVCLVPLVVVLYRLPRVSYAPEDASTAPASGAVARPGLRALLSMGQGFGLVWLAKFLVTLAETIALLYLYYYLQDVVHYRNPGQGQLILVLIATLAVIVATVAVGRLADRSGGYRRYAVLASVVLAATGFVLAGFAMWAVVVVCAFALGVGYGAFQSVSQALSMVVLPSQANAGRDLGIINIASAVPQVIGAPIAGLVVAGAGGYRGLFVFAGLLALVAAAVFTRVPSSGGS